MPGTACFVTGTDTGVGKTWVTARLLEDARAAGLRVAGLKIAESGCIDGVAADDEILFQAAGAWQPERCRYRFVPAIAPGVAADDEGVVIDVDVIAGQVERLRGLADRVLVEGAGGWFVPMGGGATIESFAQRLGLPVIIVARAGLGTINHATLTVQSVRAAGLALDSLVMSIRPDDDAAFAERNAREIERLTGLAVDRRR